MSNLQCHSLLSIRDIYYLYALCNPYIIHNGGPEDPSKELKNTVILGSLCGARYVLLFHGRY